jgi:hypothetical protein
LLLEVDADFCTDDLLLVDTVDLLLLAYLQEDGVVEEEEEEILRESWIF